MNQVTYGLGGYDTSKPFDNVVSEYDDSTRTYHDYSDGTDVSRPYTDDENAIADAEAATLVQDRIAAEHELGLHVGLELALTAAASGCERCGELLARAGAL